MLIRLTSLTRAIPLMGKKKLKNRMVRKSEVYSPSSFLGLNCGGSNCHASNTISCLAHVSCLPLSDGSFHASPASLSFGLRPMGRPGSGCVGGTNTWSIHAHKFCRYVRDLGAKG